MRKVYNLVGGYDLIFNTTGLNGRSEYSFVSTRNSARLQFSSCYKDKVIKELSELVDTIQHCGYSDNYRTGLSFLSSKIPSCYGNNWQVCDIKKVITVLKCTQVKDLKELNREQLKEKLKSFSMDELEDVINDIQQG